MLPQASNKLFVYGTLLTGIENPFTNFLNRYSKYIGKGFFFGQLYDAGYYPGAVYEPGCHEKVYGDIIMLHNKEKVLRELDMYEGIGAPSPFPYEYRREIVHIIFGTQSLPCWTYLYNHPVKHLKKIKSGNYRQYTRNEA